MKLIDLLKGKKHTELQSLIVGVCLAVAIIFLRPQQAKSLIFEHQGGVVAIIACIIIITRLADPIKWMKGAKKLFGWPLLLFLILWYAFFNDLWEGRTASRTGGGGKAGVKETAAMTGMTGIYVGTSWTDTKLILKAGQTYEVWSTDGATLTGLEWQIGTGDHVVIGAAKNHQDPGSGQYVCRFSIEHNRFTERLYLKSPSGGKAIKINVQPS